MGAVEVRTVSADQLDVVRHQRKPRPTHVKQLAAAIERTGFVVPLVVVEQEDKFVVIDGQHRLEAGRAAGLSEFPVIVVDDALARKMMSLNVEKDLNIRERCGVALSLYRELVETRPSVIESDGEIADTVEQASNVTLGLAYEKGKNLAGSAFEPILKRCDGFLEEALPAALGVREERAGRVVEANTLTKAVADALKERGMWHEHVTQQILSAANPLKRRKNPMAFDEAFDKLIGKLSELRELPERVLREGAGGG